MRQTLKLLSLFIIPALSVQSYGESYLACTSNNKVPGYTVNPIGRIDAFDNAVLKLSEKVLPVFPVCVLALRSTVSDQKVFYRQARHEFLQTSNFDLGFKEILWIDNLSLRESNPVAMNTPLKLVPFDYIPVTSTWMDPYYCEPPYNAGTAVRLDEEEKVTALNRQAFAEKSAGHAARELTAYQNQSCELSDPACQIEFRDRCASKMSAEDLQRWEPIGLRIYHMTELKSVFRKLGEYQKSQMGNQSLAFCESQCKAKLTTTVKDGKFSTTTETLIPFTVSGIAHFYKAWDEEADESTAGADLCGPAIYDKTTISLDLNGTKIAFYPIGSSQNVIPPAKATCTPLFDFGGGFAEISITDSGEHWFY